MSESLIPATPDAFGFPAREVADYVRDEFGQFAQYAQSASDAEGTIRELAAGNQPSVDKRDVGTVLAIAATRSDNPDLTELKVKGSLLFGGEGLGIARADMPQIPKDRRDEFLQLMRDQGVKVKKEDVDPRDLKPVQKEVSASRAGRFYLQMRESGTSKRIVVSKDDYVIDGHHHWGAAVALAFERKFEMPVYRIGLDHEDLLAAALEWNKTTGISGKALNE